ncbi:pentatricopeptide repeat-containing protein MRL1, chloroplastic isoform X2 [Cornus florida]|uniref:pentatricopeptide repeat-containing protein MRL1, chloroplastic isoform X2 n=1 Tax=Cornus florida TaxID=4283 RepID=UPI0028A15C89|nr:pentatricopeptide repeat-containing protein MRL1, chloroplastic isoform X2 [Cornus florida]
MDVRLSSNSQALSLISWTPLSSTSPYSLSRSRVRSLRREFLGCGRNLRPPGLRSRRKCKKLGFHIHSPRFLFKASFDLQSIVVVVAVVTVSALTIVYLNYFKIKKVGEMSGPSILALTERIRGLMNRGNVHQTCVTGDLEWQMSVTESRDLMKATETGHASENELVQLQEESVLMHDENLITNTLESHGTLQSVNFVTEMPELEFEVCGQDPESHSNLQKLMAREKLTVASTPMRTALKEVNEHNKSTLELGKGSETIRSVSILKDSVREELYMYYEANQSAMKSIANLNGSNTLSSHTSVRVSKAISVLRSSTTEGAKLLAKEFLYTAENFKGKTPLGLYKEGYPHERKDLGKSRGFSRDKGNRILPQNGHRNFPHSPHPNGKDVDDTHNLARKFSAYNRFLRNGRLIDCVELLEDMERKGLLDMDKVYHAGFFKVCKTQKAVKEAFRFIKLIQNPTLSTFNMLLSVCAISQDSEGAFQVLHLVQEAGLKADCKLYTTLVSTCAKCGKVDTMFKVFHEMVNAEVDPNVHTYGALIDGCAKAGQVAKAFGAYGIMRSKNVKPDRVVFNALITACGQSGAVDRAFDVLAEMSAETQPIEPDHVTVGALIKACANAGQVDRAREVYNMIHEYNIKGTPEVYTIAVNSCSHIGDWEFACHVYSDMTRKGVAPDEMFFSALMDVAGHARKLDSAFEVLQKARNHGVHIGIVSYSSLMGACSNANNWQKALELYEDIKSIKLKPTVSTMNALITALCDGEQLQKAVDVLSEMKRMGLCPNTITYSILFVASEKKDDLEVGMMLFSQAKKDGAAPNLIMCRCLIAMCLRRFEKACMLGEPVLSFNSGRPQIDSKWTSLALMVYRETIVAGVVPTMEECSQVLGCLKLPYDASLRSRLTEHLQVSIDTSRGSNLFSLVDGFGEYDPRAFSLLEEAASLGIVPCVSLKASPIVVDARKLQTYSAEVYFLTVLKGLKHRLAAGVRLPNITILLPVEKTQIQSSVRKKTINIAGRISQAVAALLRRLGLAYLGNESYGKIRINGVVVKKWLLPKLASPFSGKLTELSSTHSRLGKGITHQQRNIRTSNLSLE